MVILFCVSVNNHLICSLAWPQDSAPWPVQTGPAVWGETQEGRKTNLVFYLPHSWAVSCGRIVGVST